MPPYNIIVGVISETDCLSRITLHSVCVQVKRLRGGLIEKERFLMEQDKLNEVSFNGRILISSSRILISYQEILISY